MQLLPKWKMVMPVRKNIMWAFIGAPVMFGYMWFGAITSSDFLVILVALILSYIWGWAWGRDGRWGAKTGWICAIFCNILIYHVGRCAAFIWMLSPTRMYGKVLACTFWPMPWRFFRFYLFTLGLIVVVTTLSYLYWRVKIGNAVSK